MSSLWMIAYDISDDKIRREVSKLLLNHGERVQYSVFECRLTSRIQPKLRQALRNLIEDTDTIRWYQLCKSCESHIHWQGKGNTTETHEYYLV